MTGIGDLVLKPRIISQRIILLIRENQKFTNKDVRSDCKMINTYSIQVKPCHFNEPNLVTASGFKLFKQLSKNISTIQISIIHQITIILLKYHTGNNLGETKKVRILFKNQLWKHISSRESKRCVSHDIIIDCLLAACIFSIGTKSNYQDAGKWIAFNVVHVIDEFTKQMWPDDIFINISTTFCRVVPLNLPFIHNINNTVVRHLYGYTLCVYIGKGPTGA